MSHAATMVDENRLDHDPGYRFHYLAEFIGFGPDDIRAIRQVNHLLAPLIPTFVDGVYIKLFNHDATRRHFVGRQTGYEGELPRDLHSLTLEHEIIQFRKAHLGNYLRKLFSGENDPKTADYFDRVGKMHGGTRDRNIPLVQMNALMGFLSDALLTQVLRLEVDGETKQRALRAFNKLLWLQNDLIGRHYAK